ncbi:MAG: hypothetical protein LBO20_02875 [Bifidobacteriaceae bacterium]|nr:hypothetical protein [Bifidobacteriaceae bacterium]
MTQGNSGCPEHAIAPHVEADWADAFLVRLRLDGVSGKAIGAALAEVDGHLVDSGLSAREAFGDPAEYAAALELPPDPGQTGQAVRRAVWPVSAQVVGCWMTLAAVAGLAGGEPARFGLGFGVFALIMAAAPWVGGWCLRLLVDRPWLGAALLALAWAAIVLPEGLAAGLAVSLNPAAAAVVGLIGLAGGATASWLEDRAGGLEDPLEPPLPVPPRPGAGDPPAAQGRGHVLRALLIPAVTAALAALIWVLA